MSKETFGATACACGQLIQFIEQHWPHCPANPKNLDKHTLAKIEEKFTPRELAIIRSHGPNVETLHSSVTRYAPSQTAKNAGRDRTDD